MANKTKSNLIPVDQLDACAIMHYRKQQLAQQGYKGFIAVSVQRLHQLHMPSSIVWAHAAINKARTKSKVSK